MHNAHHRAQVAVLGLLGLFFGTHAARGTITNYIAGQYVWLTWAAAGLFLALAAARASELRHSGHTHPPGHNHDHAHAGSARAWVGIGITALPLVLGVLAPSEPLGSAAVDDTLANSLSQVQVAPGAPLDIAPEERTLLDWLQTIQAARDLRTLEGQRATLEGFVYRGAGQTGPEQFMVARFVVSCCVADAQAIGLTIAAEAAGAEAAALREDDWVRVRGAFRVRELDSAPALVLVADADGITPIDRPAHPYLYP